MGFSSFYGPSMFRVWFHVHLRRIGTLGVALGYLRMG